MPILCQTTNKSRNLVNPSKISKCINCRANYKLTQSIHECKICHKKLDKYFEINNTLLLIDLLLFKKEVIIHILFNRKFSLRTYVAYTTLLVIGKILTLEEIFLGRNFDPLKFTNLLYIFSEFMLYFIFLKIYLEIKWKDFPKLLLLSYYWLFNYFLVIWNYPGIDYTLIVEFIVLLNNSLGLSCLCDKKYEEIFIACFISRLCSIKIVQFFK